MPVTKNPLYGQYAIDIDSTICRLVVCPGIPANEKDEFLARHYARAMKDTTVHNQYSRWLTATGPLCKNKRLEPLAEPCKVFSFSVVKRNEPYPNCPVAVAAAGQNLVKTVIDEYGLVLESHYRTVPLPLDDGVAPMLIQVVAPAQSDIEYDRFTDLFLIELIEQL